jgi:hypothetical protein
VRFSASAVSVDGWDPSQILRSHVVTVDWLTARPREEIRTRSFRLRFDVTEFGASVAPSRGSPNAFSKKVENHMHALSIYFMHYNFVRIHQTLRCSPAMEAGVTTKLWSLEDIVGIVDEWEKANAQNGKTDPDL